jgi:hypothetical protein
LSASFLQEVTANAAATPIIAMTEIFIVFGLMLKDRMIDAFLEF